ncbi:MAG: alkaline phosphatase family protein [bacterium]
MKRIILLISAFIALECAVLLGALGCSESKSPLYSEDELAAKSNPTDIKVLIIGIDGATFRVIDPLLAQGKLPHIHRLMEEGTHGILESNLPYSSPALWTSVATGRSPKIHGITSFSKDKNGFNRFLSKMGIKKSSGGIRARINWQLTKYGIRQKVLPNSTHRKVSALWNWMGPFDKTTGFCGWWASWPAEKVNGWIISDRVTRSRFAEWEGTHKTERLTYWPDLIDQLQPLIVDPADPPMDEINSLVELSPDELSEFNAARKPIFAHSLSVFKFAYCSQRSYENFALYMLDKGQPDLTGVFLVANDPISHTFWHFYEPEKFEGVDPETARRLGKLLPNFWEHNDDFLGELLTKIDSNTVVMITSDHGFEASGIVPKPVSSEEFDELEVDAVKSGIVAVGQSGKHQMDGVLIAWGPYIKRGLTVHARLVDIAPTVLALMGLPVPDDMEGRVLSEMIDPGFIAEHPVQHISSFEDYIDRRENVAVKEVNEEEMLEKLRALGYVK